LRAEPRIFGAKRFVARTEHSGGVEHSDQSRSGEADLRAEPRISSAERFVARTEHLSGVERSDKILSMPGTAIQQIHHMSQQPDHGFQ
jgi:hypothetical protein